MAKRISRRDVTRAVPLLLVASAMGGIGRFLVACTSDSSSSLKGPTSPDRSVPPNDQDEFVPPNDAPPINTGDAPPKVPNRDWEARARQLEDDQKRIYGNIFSSDQTQNGPFKGKEASHVPTGVYSLDGALKHVVITVAHVMGSNGLDAGPYDAAADAPREAEAGPVDGGDAGDAALDAAGDAAVDAGKPPVHYITTVYLRGMVNGVDTVVGLWEFQSTDPAPAKAQFTLPEGVTEVTAWEYCTLHGLWKSDPIATA